MSTISTMRTRETIERELRLLATVRNAYREHGYVLPSKRRHQVKALDGREGITSAVLFNQLSPI